MGLVCILCTCLCCSRFMLPEILMITKCMQRFHEAGSSNGPPLQVIFVISRWTRRVLDPELDISSHVDRFLVFPSPLLHLHSFSLYHLNPAIMPLAPNRGGGSSRGRGNNTRFTGRRGGPSKGKGRGGGGGVAYGIDRPAPKREDDGTAAAEKFEEVRIWDEIDEKLGFYRFESNRASGEEKTGWLVNMHQVSKAQGT